MPSTREAFRVIGMAEQTNPNSKADNGQIFMLMIFSFFLSSFKTSMVKPEKYGITIKSYT